ncbi:hypothetical protein SAMN02746098_00371 [Desulfosporosinus lacus DSM 15449]|uniref:Uncharacterized protein n=1 Tax=Desulfosporosinus lacus DSM 15449 TaxID=1121420 RepID=A0A1M5QVA0_9FIRM|nr:hypothetical protein SAMN02746098_00371 [Desulfosporosinus lacus DSM 15449]
MGINDRKIGSFKSSRLFMTRFLLIMCNNVFRDMVSKHSLPDEVTL